MPAVPEAPDIGGLLPGGASEVAGVPTADLPAVTPADDPAAAQVVTLADEPTAALADDPAAAPVVTLADEPTAALADDPAAAPADLLPPATPDFGLARWHGQCGIGPQNGGSLWRGERIDWGWALACLWREGGDGDGGTASGLPER